MAFHHHIHHAMLQQIFRCLEAFRQLFAKRLLNDTLARQSLFRHPVLQYAHHPAWRRKR